MECLNYALAKVIVSQNLVLGFGEKRELFSFLQGI